MKKILYSLFIVILFGSAFWAGSEKHGQNAGEAGAQDQKSTGEQCHADAADIADEDSDSSLMRPGSVAISPEKQQIIGVCTDVVEKNCAAKNLRFLGKVAPDETRVFKVNAAVDGMIRKVSSLTTGSMVKKDQLLASFYSPEIYAIAQGYIIALSRDRYQDNPQAEINKNKLLFLGMSESQVNELRDKSEFEEIIALRSPAAGFVVARNASVGLRFQKGDELYRIVKLDRVWIFADIYESEAQYLKPQTSVTISHPRLAKECEAKVSDVLPLFDDDSRTLKVRLEADNPDLQLKPDMFVDIELSVSMPPAITVPQDAILDSGLKQTVFIDLGDGRFEPREVETGWRADSRVEIKKGLEPGERIVVSGTFLIDSESRLEMAAAGMYDTITKDLVSGLDVSIGKAEKAGRKFVYMGKTYYFDTEENKAQFVKNPEKYINLSKQ